MDFFKKQMKGSGEIENQLCRISSRARNGETEGALRKESHGEMIRIRTQGSPIGCFLLWEEENFWVQSLGELGKLELSTRDSLQHETE